MAGLPSKRPLLRKLTRTFGFFALFYGITAVLLFFQNCGQRPLETVDRIPVQSPFFAKRVHLTKESYVTKISNGQKLEDDANVPVSVVIDNKCARESCAQEPSDSTSVACALVRNDLLEPLKDSNQAYDWEVRSNSSEASVDAYLQRTQTDQDCILGVSIARHYKSSQAQAYLDPAIAHQYHHEVLKTAQALNALGSLASVTVGVIDTGIDVTHSELKDIPGLIDWPLNTAQCATICNFHGTFVGGIIAAKRDNAIGGYGIAPNALLRSYRIGNSQGGLTSTELYNAMLYALGDKVEILNLSLGGSGLIDQSIQDAMVRLIQAETLVVVAAGNDGRNIDNAPLYPASFNYDGQVNVGAASPDSVNPSAAGPYNVTTSPINRDGYSNYSSAIVHIAAPGQAIYSTMPGDLFGKASGTSFAAPMVSGALALLKGYLKLKGYTTVSAPILKGILLENSRTVTNLNGQVKDGKYLDLLAVANGAKKFVETMTTNPVMISITNSSTVTVGPSKFVRVQIEVQGGNPNAGQIIKVHTNRAFLTESDLNLTCAIVQARQFCEFDVPYSALYADPELYFVLRSSSGANLADLNVPKANLELGDRTAANIEGGIIMTRAVAGYAHIEGWACLKGFADQLDIEVRENSPASAPVRYLKTVRQARGDFFSRCDSPSIEFGFTYIVPPSKVMNGQDKYYFFKALHAGTGKTLDLPVYTYLPKHNDPQPPSFQTAVLIPAQLNEATPQVRITTREFRNGVLKVGGSACFPNRYLPATFTLGLRKGEPFAFFPEAYKEWTGNQTVASFAEAKIESVSNNWKLTNPGAYNYPASAGAVVCGSGFSDISMLCAYADSRLPKPLSILLTQPVIDQELTPAQGMTPRKMESIYNSNVGSGLVTVTPWMDMGDGCPAPSGFYVELDYKPWITSITLNAGYTYRSDMISKAQAQSALGPNQLLLMKPAPTNDFANVVFSSRAFTPVLNFYGLGNSPANFDLAPGVTLLHSLVDFQVAFAVSTLNFASNWIESSSRAGTVPMKLWGANLNLPVAPGSGAGLTTVWDSGPIGLVYPNSTQAMTSLSFRDGAAFGALGNDFRVEFMVNGNGVWYEAPIDVQGQSSVNGQINGTLIADFDLPAPATSIQWRIRASGANIFTISTFGFMTQ